MREFLNSAIPTTRTLSPMLISILLVLFQSPLSIVSAHSLIRTAAGGTSMVGGEPAMAQVPTGSIAGVVRDSSGAAVPGAQVKAVSVTTALARTITTSQRGDFSFPILPAGGYEVSVESPGFQGTARHAEVEGGTTTTADLTLRVGDVKDSLTVEGASPQLHFDSHTVDGVVTQSEIQDLPLNGRNFLELAKLEPGVQAPSRSLDGRTFVPVLGAPPGGASGRGTRVTIDGGSIMAPGYAGSKMSLSQEAVQEFQVSSVNFDLSTGMTMSGAVNVVTRSGGNDLHGAAFYFFRDHNLAAYPALNRDPANPDPFFQRRQFGIGRGNWYFQWGLQRDLPGAGDFDGDGKTDITVYRPSTGEWFLRLSSRNYAMAAGNWYLRYTARLESGSCASRQKITRSARETGTTCGVCPMPVPLPATSTATA